MNSWLNNLHSHRRGLSELREGAPGGDPPGHPSRNKEVPCGRPLQTGIDETKDRGHYRVSSGQRQEGDHHVPGESSKIAQRRIRYDDREIKVREDILPSDLFLSPERHGDLLQSPGGNYFMIEIDFRPFDRKDSGGPISWKKSPEFLHKWAGPIFSHPFLPLQIP